MLKSLLSRILCAVLLLGLTAAARAQSLADRVPADANVCILWQGADNLKAKYADSHLKTILDNTTIQDFIEKKLPEIMDKAGTKNPDQLAVASTLLTVGSSAWKYPGALYLSPLDLHDPDAPKVSGALLCKAGADAPALAKQIKDLLAKAPPQDEDAPKVVCQLAGDCVLLLVGDITPANMNALTGAAGAKPISSVPAYKTALAQIDKDAALIAYVDFVPLRKALLDAFAAAPEQEVRTNGPRILDVLGFGTVTQAVYCAGFSGKVWDEQAHLSFDGPRKGLFALWNGKPVDPELLRAVPKDAPMFNTSRSDFPALYKALRDGIGQVDPNVLKQFDAGVASFETNYKLSIEKDILAPLGDQWVTYRTMRPHDQRMPQGFVLINRLADARKAAETLALVEQTLAAQGLPIPLTNQKVGDLDATVVTLGPISVGWLIADDYLVVSFADELEAAVAQIKSKKNSILDNPDYIALQKRFGNQAKQAIMLDYGNPKPGYLIVAKALDQLIGFAAMSGVEIPNTVIPDAELIDSALVPGGGAFWSDAAGLHFHAVTAFPGAGLISGQQSSMVPAVAVLPAILLPSLGRARELSNRAYEAANLRGIGQSCNVWAADHADAMPEHLAQLVAANQISPKQLVSKRSNTKPAEITAEQMAAAEKDWTVIKKIIDEHSDVVYVGKGLKADTDSSQILVYSDTAKVSAKDGMNVGFSDGHVEWVRPNSWADIFKTANEARKTAKYPEIDTPKPQTVTKKKATTAPAAN